ncbi:MAG: hypothetical protein ACON5H_09595 [Akkermansiaceae bacterium]
MGSAALKVHGAWAIGLVAAFVIGSHFPLDSTSKSEAELGSGTQESAVRVSSRGSSSNASSGALTRAKNGFQTSGEALTEVFPKRLDAADLDSLAMVAFTEPNQVMRRLAFAKLLASVTAENAPQIREQLKELGAGGQELRDFNYAWGALAGRDAFNIAAQGNKRDLESLISGWAAVDPDGAIAMLDQLPDDLLGEKRRLESGLVAGLADRNQDEAADFVQSLADTGNENARRHMSTVVGEVLRSEGHEQASIWVERLTDGPLKGVAMDRIAGRYVRDNPEAASRWIAQFASEEYAAEAVREVGKEWAEKNPIAAVTWLDQLPEGKGQRDGLNSAFGDWEDSDPAAAGKYLNSMTDSPKRDSAISGFAIGLAYQEPATAVAWANEISDSGLRNSALIQTGQTYFQRDPEGAKAWLAASGLPAALQTKIQEAPRRRRR